MDINAIMKEAQNMQAKLAEVQKKISEEESNGVSGGGLVIATMKGDGRLLKIKIAQELFKPEDSAILEDLVVAAVNNAKAETDRKSSALMSQVTGGMNLPAGFKL